MPRSRTVRAQLPEATPPVDSSAGRKVAYVTARYPPMESCGTIRVEAVRDFLPSFGFEPIFVTLPAAWVAQQANPGLAAAVTADPSVLRPGARSDPVVRAIAKVPVLRRAQRWYLLPDLLRPWARGLTRHVATSLSDVEAVIATGPPYSALEAGHRLGAALGVPVILELRDPPTANRRSRKQGRYVLRRLHRFERRYLTAADAVIAVTPGMRDLLVAAHPELDPDRVHVVSNGYPEADIDPDLSGRSAGVFTISYIGSFRDESDLTTIAVIARALEKLRAPAELRLIGQQPRQVRNGPPFPDGDVTVSVHGRVPRDRALAELITTDVALVLAEGSEHWWIGRKVFESLALARRILAVVPPGDTDDLLRASAKSVIVRPGQVAALEDAVAGLYRAWAAGRVVDGSEPAVPSDRQSVEGIAAVLRQTLPTRSRVRSND